MSSVIISTFCSPLPLHHPSPFVSARVLFRVEKPATAIKEKEIYSIPYHKLDLKQYWAGGGEGVLMITFAFCS
jgi:hypothetical protein